MNDQAQHGAMQLLWQSQSVKHVKAAEVDMTRIRGEAEKFEKTIRSRNRRETWAAWAVALWFMVVACSEFWSGDLISSAGGVVVSAGALWILFALRRWGTANVLDDELDSDGVTFMRYYHRQVVRQRQLLRFAWLWYCMPIVAGLTLLSLGRAFEQGLALDQWLRSIELLLIGAVWMAVAILNLSAARKLGSVLKELGN